MTDRELLEAAARAVNGGAWHPLTHDTPNGKWDPLTDDGDALRLAVARGLTVHHYLETREVGVCLPYCDEDIVTEFYNADPCAATRRAIVRAAASMGEKA